jgi:hypothetical protein
MHVALLLHHQITVDQQILGQESRYAYADAGGDT